MGVIYIYTYIYIKTSVCIIYPWSLNSLAQVTHIFTVLLSIQQQENIVCKKIIDCIMSPRPAWDLEIGARAMGGSAPPQAALIYWSIFLLISADKYFN